MDDPLLQLFFQIFIDLHPQSWKICKRDFNFVVNKNLC